MIMKLVETYFNDLAKDWDSHRDDKARNRIKSLVETLPINNGDDVLDVACGTGEISSLLFQRTSKKITAIDISANMIEIAKKKHQSDDIEFLVGDFTTTTFDKKFDKIVIFDAYPHFLNVDELKHSLYRNLKNDGVVIIFHDISKHQLDHCHSGQRVMKVSRSIDTPLNEYKSYMDLFDFVKGEDNDDSYFLIMKKKSA